MNYKPSVGDSVHYQPSHGDPENGVVKEARGQSRAACQPRQGSD